MKIRGRIVQQTSWAVLLLCRGRRVWLPKSLVQVQAGAREKVSIRLPAWLALHKGFE